MRDALLQIRGEQFGSDVVQNKKKIVVVISLQYFENCTKILGGNHEYFPVR